MSKKKRSREERKQYIFALKQMSAREIKRKYARSHLGIVWSVLNPLLSMAVISMIFSTIFKRSIENFPIYYMTGFVLWNFFSTATNTAMTALVDNKNLLLKVKMSKQTFVLSRILTALVNLGYTCIAYIMMLLVFQVKLSYAILLLPVPVFFLTLFSTGISYILSIAYVFFADIKHLYGVLLTLWMYMCAIFYPVDNVPIKVQSIIKINPLYSYIEFARECVLNQNVPPLSVWIKMILWGLGMFFVGWYVFKRKENSVMQKV